MYQALSFEPGGRPDWPRFMDIVTPNARLVRITDDGIFEFSRESYRADFEHMISIGEWPSLWEGELWRDARIFGELAHVLSAYETRRTRNGPPLNRGVNSIQLFRRDGRWQISSVLWRREGAAVTVRDLPT